MHEWFASPTGWRRYPSGGWAWATARCFNWCRTLGGFFLPFVLGAVRDATGSYAAGLFGCAVTFVGGTLVLLELGARWSQRWDSAAVQRTGLYSYRGMLVEADDERVA